MTGLLNWAVRCFTETETMMNSVERVLYTSQVTPQEPPHHVSRCETIDCPPCFCFCLCLFLSPRFLSSASRGSCRMLLAHSGCACRLLHEFLFAFILIHLIVSADVFSTAAVSTPLAACMLARFAVSIVVLFVWEIHEFTAIYCAIRVCVCPPSSRG